MKRGSVCIQMNTVSSTVNFRSRYPYFRSEDWRLYNVFSHSLSFIFILSRIYKFCNGYVYYFHFSKLKYIIVHLSELRNYPKHIGGHRWKFAFSEEFRRPSVIAGVRLLFSKDEKWHAVLHVFSLWTPVSVNTKLKMSQVILYLLTELSRKLKQLMFGPDARSGLKQEANGTDVLDGTADPAAGKREAFGRSRLPTMVNVDGFGQCIAVLTSGGDAQGRKKYLIHADLLKDLFSSSQIN